MEHTFLSSTFRLAARARIALRGIRPAWRSYRAAKLRLPSLDSSSPRDLLDPLRGRRLRKKGEHVPGGVRGSTASSALHAPRAAAEDTVVPLAPPAAARPVNGRPSSAVVGVRQASSRCVGALSAASFSSTKRHLHATLFSPFSATVSSG